MRTDLGCYDAAMNVRWLACLVIVSCSSPKDPALAALEQFRAFASATYPGGNYTQAHGMAFTCEVTKVDVVKTTSVSSPFAGVIEAHGTRTVAKDSAEELKAHTVFANDGHGWTCDPTQSTYEDVTDHQPPQPDPDCSLLEMCLGKPKR
jgi:hypothetical protein